MSTKETTPTAAETVVLQTIESNLNITLSDEQRVILLSGLQQPTLINACAGAGKTTTMIMSICYEALLNRCYPADVLGVTFSKRAQLDMGDKYVRIAQKIMPTDNHGQPTFSTFHALFLRLLRMLYPQQQIKIVNVGKYQSKLYQVIKDPVDALTIAENVSRYTDVMSKLINYGYSNDGLQINYQNRNVQTILSNLKTGNDLATLLAYFGQSSEDYYHNYVNVITKYRNIKQQAGAIDFDDMQGILYWAITNNPNARQVCRQYMNRFSRLYLDEFQDINPLQWSIMQIIMPETLQQHLVTIGDDDQSIYSFRGSDSGYILNFDQQIPNAQHFNLSTNYRTASNILDIVKPMIQSNTLRLTKSLKAHRKGGKILIGHRGLYADPALEQFIKDIKAQPDKSYAILSRDNLNLSVLSDKLAEQEVYPNLGDTYNIFQNTRIYKIIISIMMAMYNDSYSRYLDNSNYIGFGTYKKALQGLNQHYEKLSEFLESSDANQILKGRMRHIHRTLERTIATIQVAKSSDNPKLKKRMLSLLYLTATSLTEDYFTFVIKHRYVSYSNDDYKNVIMYLESLIDETPQPEEFFALETMKATSLENVITSEDRHIQAITMHSSKGLEFDETLIYESQASNVTTNEFLLAKHFPAKLTIKQLKDKLIKAKEPEIIVALLATNNITSLDLLMKRWFKDKEARDQIVNQLVKLPNKLVLMPEEQSKIDFSILNQDQNLLNLLYMEISTISKKVEEEKRIYYVAITRAKDKIIFDRGEKVPTIDTMLNLEKAKTID